jgi:hypothetical protein
MHMRGSNIMREGTPLNPSGILHFVFIPPTS